MRWYTVVPGHTAIAIAALKLFGNDRVDCGSYASPVKVLMLPEEVEAFKALAEEHMSKNVLPENIQRFKLLPLSIFEARY
jgi:hypothetical protein